MVNKTTMVRTPQLQTAENLQTNPTKIQIQTVDSLPAPKESMKVYENGVTVNLMSPQQGARYNGVVPLTGTATYTRQEELAFFLFSYLVDGVFLGGEEQIGRTFTTKLDLPAGEHRLDFAVDAITKAQKAIIDKTGTSLFLDVASGYVEVSFFVRPMSFFSLTVDVPQNSSSAQLVFSVSRPVAWAGYSVDGHTNVTVPTTTVPSSVFGTQAGLPVRGNTTLTGLSPGWHNVTVYATDLAGRNGISETVTFNVTEPFPESFPEPFPTTLIATAAVAIAAAVTTISLTVYFKKQKQKPNQPPNHT
jgi:hypothetical protein